MNSGDQELQALSKDQLIEVIRMFAKNWYTLDGLWFRAAEEEYGLEAALKLDYKMWESDGIIEAKRIKKLFHLSDGGPEGVVKAIHFMTWAPSTGYRCEPTPNGVLWTCTYCPAQEARKRNGLVEHPCKPAGISCFGGAAQVIDPMVRVRCVFCPPDPHPEDSWCQWEFTL
jgi:hypothetical protein